MFDVTSEEKAYIGPFLTFIALIALAELVAKPFEGLAFWAVSTPRYWLYPLQTAVCGALLAKGWRWYALRRPDRLGWTTLAGVAVFLIWISPQEVFGAAPRTDGFNPAFFADRGLGYALNLSARFLRLVIVVPLVEEIFWRGFLLRYLIRPDFLQVPFGQFSWWSFSIVTAGFCIEHQSSDWPAAIAAGALYNLVAYKTRNLASCVLAHAITNLLLGAYVLRTWQWGFW